MNFIVHLKSKSPLKITEDVLWWVKIIKEYSLESSEQQTAIIQYKY